MPTYTVNVGLNKIAVAQEVLESAAKILLAAGFERGDVRSMFRQAAEQIESTGLADSEVAPDDDSSHRAPFEAGGADTYDLLERYERTPERKSLARLAKRASTLGYTHDEEYAEKAYDILQQALPLAEAALSWIINECSVSGIQFEISKDEWLETASDEELDREKDIVFLDDWQLAGDFQLDQIDALARIHAQSGDLGAYQRLLDLVGQHKVFYGKHLDEIERATEALESMPSFISFIAGHRGQGELPQSTLLDEFIRESGFSKGTYILEGWLDSMAKKGQIERYKRSNRWRIVV